MLIMISCYSLNFILTILIAATVALQIVTLPSNKKIISTTTSFSIPKNRVLSAGKNLVSASGEKTASDRNIFHEYDKPLVLVGCSSSAGDELSRLANFFLSETKHLGTSNVIQLAARKDDELLNFIEIEKLGWPNILVLDFGDLFEEKADGIEADYETLARQFYEENCLLSIYVNVDSSQLKDEAADRKERLENNVFVKYSDYEICIRDEGTMANDCQKDWKHIEWEFLRLLARARLIPAVPGDKMNSANSACLTLGLHTFFLSLSFPDIRQVEPYVEQMCQDVDLMEYRADLLDCRESRFDLIYGMQLLRKFCRPFTLRVPALAFGSTVITDVMPIVYTVRTVNQAGTYPDDIKGISKMFELLGWGLRGGVEVLDVESAWDLSQTDCLLKKAEERYSTQILGSHHVVGRQIEREDAVSLFQECALNGRAHAAKVVISIDSEEKDRMAYEAALIASELAEMEGDPVIPNIALILGDAGQFSRVINFPCTPVTHESLPFKAAPGQLTANEIMTVRLLTGLFKPKKFCILGHNIAYSVSPQMHGAAFAATKLPHEYIRFDVETVEEFIESAFFQSEDFGGASVTIPHKQSIIPFVNKLSDAARTIGSVNTLNVRMEFSDGAFKRVIYGDNTDWRGIYNPLERLLGGIISSASRYALILGAGGTARAAAYAAKKLGLTCLYYNRTVEKAMSLAQAFGGTVLTSLEQTSGHGMALGDVVGGSTKEALFVIVSTLPAASNFVLPAWLLNMHGSKPIVFDVTYKPYYTALLRQAEAMECDVVRGSEMLWEQGVGQFEIFCERSAPYSVMKEVVLKNCQ